MRIEGGGMMAAGGHRMTISRTLHRTLFRTRSMTLHITLQITPRAVHDASRSIIRGTRRTRAHAEVAIVDRHATLVLRRSAMMTMP
jgi:hypothetical protein